MKDINHEGYVCGLCSEVFDTRLLKNQHRRIIHGKSKPKGEMANPQSKFKIVCEECGKIYSSQGALKNHWDITHATGVKVYSCDQCDKVFQNQIYLKSHVSRNHNKQPCTMCGKMVARVRMKRHMSMSHTDDHLMPFNCQICQKGFPEKRKLKDHMNTHSGNKPYVCKYCGKGFSDRGNMRMHERTTHEGYKRPNKNNKMGPEDDKHLNLHSLVQ